MQDLERINLPYQQDSRHYYLQIMQRKYSVWLDSARHQAGQATPSHSGRYDILSADPEVMLSLVEQQCLLEYCEERREIQADSETALQSLQGLLSSYPSIEPQDLPFCGGLLGYFGYELKSLTESAHCQQQHSSPVADMMVGLYLWAIIVDHQEQRCQLIIHPSLNAQKRQSLIDDLKHEKTPTLGTFELTQAFHKDTSKSQYQQAFEKIQDYIAGGDCYQINYTQRFSARYQGACLSAYLHLRDLSPAPFSAFLDFPRHQILSHSPERFIACHDGQVETKPIKGTLPRGRTPAEDLANAQTLLSSSKDRAENLMIVDLLRNDLSKSCRLGSVKVPKLFGLESYANVHHLVSTIHAELDTDKSALELFIKAFPGGSITGAPKVRAMQIIDELECNGRSVYCGSVAYFSLCGNSDSSITIRTLVADGENIFCWGGGGIVADSDCEAEYQESLTKVSNLMRALEGM